MSIGNVFFCLCSLVTLVGAVGTVISKNPIRSAVGLLTAILGIAGLFLELSAQFLAAVQLIVYAGAVVVLFVFVIMVLGPDAVTTAGPELASPRARWSRWLGAALLVLVTLVVGALAASVNSAPVAFGKLPANYGGVEGVGQLLFTQGLVPFELATALLIVAVVGAIAVARSHHGVRERKVLKNPQLMFTGPLHPRDAGRAIAKEGLS